MNSTHQYTFEKVPAQTPYPPIQLGYAPVKYTIHENRKWIGEYVHNSGTGVLRTEDQTILIEFKQPLFRKASYKLLDPETREQIGHFEIPAFRKGRWLYYQNLPLYEFRRTPHKLRDVFKRSYWNTHTFTLTNFNGAVTYQLLHRRTLFRTPHATGEIQIKGRVPLSIVLAGLFLIERYFEDQTD